MGTDKIIWLDGHVSTIASEEASRNMYEYPTDGGWDKTLKGLFCISFETPYWQASPRPKRTSWQYYVCADKYIITSRTELTSCTICVVA